ncbi:(R)-phenyllactate dehydratase activator [anaerobic digester metagenome]
MLLEDGERIIGTELLVAGIGTVGAEKIMETILGKAQLTRDDIDYVMATGYGRRNFDPAHGELSELSCHAKGVLFKNPQVRTIIDIGGQDAKVLRINDKGVMENFMMNDKCAAGTGRFLDVMANILQMPIGELEKRAKLADKPAKISSTCTVFAESEVISQLASGETVENVIAGICNSVASRVAGLAKRVGIKEEVFMSGGVAKNGGVRSALEKELKVSIKWSDTSQMMGALGAAISAFEQVKKRGV